MPYIAETLENNSSAVRHLFEDYAKVAQSQYGWGAPMVPFEIFEQLCQQGLFQGYIARDTVTSELVGLLVFEQTSYKVVEPRILYLQPGCPVKTVFDCLVGALMSNLEQSDAWTSVSFSLLGPASKEWVHYFPWYGFKPVGQGVFEFELDNVLSQEVFKRSELPARPQGMQIRTYKPSDDKKLAALIFEAFSESVDALWDSRLWTEAGTAEAIRFITQGEYGQFMPELSFILEDAVGQPIGFCFASELLPGELNIPLIGIYKKYRQQKLGPILLKHVVQQILNLKASGKLNLDKISATAATDNYAAVKMYRLLGFNEAYWYPHVYITQAMLAEKNAQATC